MNINFRQGVIKYPSTGLLQSFLVKSSSTPFVSLSVANGVTTLTAAHKNADYLITENATTSDAWGPLPQTVTCYLYININQLTGLRTFGFTTVRPTFGGVQPESPVDDLHWFNTSTNVHYVYANGVFSPVIRVFVAGVNGSTFIPLGAGALQTPYAGTQVGITSQANPGYILIKNGRAILTEDGTFLTSTTLLSYSGVQSNTVRLDATLIDAIAVENIAQYQVVKYSDFDQISLANYDDLGSALIGIVLDDVLVGQRAAVILDGKITNPSWNWQVAGQPLWISTSGQLTTVNPHLSNSLIFSLDQPPVGRVVTPDTIVFMQGMGGKGEQGDRGSGGGGGDVAPATNTSLGTIVLSVPATNPVSPVVVGDNDPRMTANVRKIGDTMTGILINTTSVISPAISTKLPSATTGNIGLQSSTNANSGWIDFKTSDNQTRGRIGGTDSGGSVRYTAINNKFDGSIQIGSSATGPGEGAFSSVISLTPSGAILLSNDPGIAGQVLVSNGPSQPAEWSNIPSPTFSNGELDALSVALIQRLVSQGIRDYIDNTAVVKTATFADPNAQFFYNYAAGINAKNKATTNSELWFSEVAPITAYNPVTLPISGIGPSAVTGQTFNSITLAAGTTLPFSIGNKDMLSFASAETNYSGKALDVLGPIQSTNTVVGNRVVSRATWPISLNTQYEYVTYKVQVDQLDGFYLTPGPDITGIIDVSYLGIGGGFIRKDLPYVSGVTGSLTNNPTYRINMPTPCTYEVTHTPFTQISVGYPTDMTITFLTPAVITGANGLFDDPFNPQTLELNNLSFITLASPQRTFKLSQRDVISPAVIDMSITAVGAVTTPPNGITWTVTITNNGSITAKRWRLKLYMPNRFVINDTTQPDNITLLPGASTSYTITGFMPAPEVGSAIFAVVPPDDRQVDPNMNNNIITVPVPSPVPLSATLGWSSIPNSTGTYSPSNTGTFDAYSGYAIFYFSMPSGDPFNHIIEFQTNMTSILYGNNPFAEAEAIESPPNPIPDPNITFNIIGDGPTLVWDAGQNTGCIFLPNTSFATSGTSELPIGYVDVVLKTNIGEELGRLKLICTEDTDPIFGYDQAQYVAWSPFIGP